jgi:titin
MKTIFLNSAACFKGGWGIIFWLAGSWAAMGAGYTVINTNDSGEGSLRQAIIDVNANGESATISFQIPGNGPFTISPQSTYPPINLPVIIDGTTQTGYHTAPLIQINGKGIGANGDGLMIQGGGSTILGLAIYRCKRDGIRISGFGTNIIQACYLGTDASGTNVLGNQEAGVYIFRSSVNLIGGTSAQARNVISGNAHGIYIDDGSPPPTGTGNMVQGNYIGTTAAGTQSLGNTNNGVYITSAPGNLIGGTSPGAGNLISGNFLSGVYISGSVAVSNVVAGNLIGTEVTGTAILGNGMDGITLYGASTNWIGGTTAGAGNILSGNRARGILIINANTNNATGNVIQGNYIGTDITGLIALPNGTNGVIISGGSGNLIGGPDVAARNLISGNDQNGILVTQTGSSNNCLQGNFIGTDQSGTRALPNTFSGITLNGAFHTLVGGTNAGSGNLISGNLQNGIYVETNNGGGHQVLGNLIGTDVSGQSAISNHYSGIWIESAGNQIGGSGAAARNLISGNGNNGIYLNGSGASNNVVQGNYIGTDRSGSVALANGASGLYSGIYANGAPGNAVGGGVPGTGNLISGNGDKGISLNGSGCTGNVIQGNYIGADQGGTQALPNANGGIYIFNAPTNTIGGTNAGTGNLISGNNADGVYVSAATNTVIQGNCIGTQADGVTALGNLWHNIEFLNNASYCLVGGTVPAADNRIAFTRTPQYDGVRVRAGSVGNKILRNAFFSNGAGSVNGLGICVGAVGVNTNGLPVFTRAIEDSSGGGVAKGVLANTPNTTFQLQLYANISPNISGYGEGRLWLGTTNITTDATGGATFTWPLNTNISAGQYLSATLTDSTNNTSEFAADIQVQTPPPFSLAVSNYLVNVVTNYDSGIHTNRKTGVVTTNPPSVQVISNYTRTYFLNWPTNPPGFSVLQSTSLIPSSSWVPLTNPAGIFSNQYRIPLPLTNSGNRFFRLQSP